MPSRSGGAACPGRVLANAHTLCVYKYIRQRRPTHAVHTCRSFRLAAETESIFVFARSLCILVFIFIARFEVAAALPVSFDALMNGPYSCDALENGKYDSPSLPRVSPHP